MIVSSLGNKQRLYVYLARFQSSQIVKAGLCLRRSMTSSNPGVSSPHLSKEAKGSPGTKRAICGDSKSRWSGKLALAKPKSSFTSHLDIRGETEDQPKEKFLRLLEECSDERGHLSYSLSLASKDDSFNDPEFLDLLDERMRGQIEKVCSQHDVIKSSDFKSGLNHKASKIESTLIHDDLPVNYSEATRHNDSRAIVVTEMKIPFRIVQVNEAWENLCGYNASECIGQTLSCIQGPETDKGSLTALMAQLLKGEKAGTTVTNYRKDRTKFRNYLSVGPLKDQNGISTHFVGVLRATE